MIASGRSRRSAIGAALVLATVFGVPGAARAGEAAGPAWLRAPKTRGPVAGSFAYDGERAWWGFDSVLPLSFGFARGTTPAEGPPALGLGLSVAGRGFADGRELSATALVDRRGPHAGAWLGLSNGGGGDRLHLATGLWRAVASVEYEAGLASSLLQYDERIAEQWSYWPDSLHRRDTTTFRDHERTGLSTTVHGTLRWRHGRLELATVGGLTAGEGASLERWAQATMHFQASRRLLLTAAYGDRPAAAVAFDPTARPKTMVGAQLALWSSPEWAMSKAIAARALAWQSRALGNGQTLVRVRCRDATSVEIAGDFSEWTPLPLRAAGRGWWQAVLAIGPGLHHVQVRLDDGAWQAPPGLPRANGEFIGPAGVLVVE